MEFTFEANPTFPSTTESESAERQRFCVVKGDGSGGSGGFIPPFSVAHVASNGGVKPPLQIRCEARLNRDK